jgi:hypothetical protein
MGAINKTSKEREAPLFADKKNSYMCPDCNKDVIFKKGKIKKANFAHKASEIKCTFYDKPSETQIHKEAKILMKSLLDNMKELNFYRKCSDCDKHKNIDIYYNDNMKAIIEYKFNYNNSNKSADVALVEDNNIKYIFEICYKNKTKECNDLGIRLIHIWLHDWVKKEDIIKSQLKNILHKTDTKIYARNCDIREVNFSEAKSFLNKNHLQGNSVSKYRYGLYYNNELVQIITFGKLRRATGRKSKPNSYELIRSCNKINTNVVGGVSKLFNHFISEYNPE